jgi:hypothetical protein
MNIEYRNKPSDTLIFPIPFATIEDYFAMFKGFSESQIAIVTGSNALLVEPSDPAYPLLHLTEHPELSRPGAENDEFFHEKATAYRAGVCIGLAIIRHRVEEMLHPAYDPDSLLVQPDRRYLVGGDPLSVQILGSFLLGRSIVADAQEMVEPLSYLNYVTDPDTQQVSAESVTPMGDLKTEWHRKMSFMILEGRHVGEPDNLGLGISHAFRLYSSLEDNQIAGIVT